MEIRDWDLRDGKLHRQIDPPDRREYELSCTVDGHPLSILVILPEGMDRDAIAAELRSRAEKIASMFAGTPARIAYDAISEATPAGFVAGSHTFREIAEAGL